MDGRCGGKNHMCTVLRAKPQSFSREMCAHTRKLDDDGTQRICITIRSVMHSGRIAIALQQAVDFGFDFEALLPQCTGRVPSRFGFCNDGDGPPAASPATI